ncbi:MAG: CHAP domain-containing protein [Clostridia bacterium]|nr:CHAP domain-containing protein [Clostridia bacterium]
MLIIVTMISFSVVTLRALSPTYSVSSSYKASSYYTSLCNVSLTGNQRQDIINVALSQVGYREGNYSGDYSGADDGSYNNYTEYNYWYNKNVSSGMPVGGSTAPWCATFVSWCAEQANIPATILKRSTAAGHGASYFNINFYSGSSTLASSGDNDSYFKGYNYIPKTGDLFYTRSWSHVGLVVAVNGAYVTTVEGNTNTNGSSEGNGVYKRTRAIGDLYFGVPDYTGTPTHNVDYSFGTNFTAYPKEKITASNIFDAYHSQISSTAWIGTSDLCTIYEVYTDGCCKISYPLDDGGYQTAYSKISLFDISHTCNYSELMWYEAVHPHYNCYKCTICGEVKRNTNELNYIDSCDDCINHICGYDTLMWYEAVHPHYNDYKCLLCGEINRNPNEINYVDSCTHCNHPDKPSFKELLSDYSVRDDIEFSWDSVKNATHYNLWIFYLNENNEWKEYTHIFYADSGYKEKLPSGEYRCAVQAYNSNFWNDTNTDWIYSQSDYYYFTVKEITPQKPTLNGFNTEYTTADTVTFLWDSVENATHYNLWVYYLNDDEEWHEYTHIFYVNNGHFENFPNGEYKCALQAYNSNYWNEDYTDWVYSQSDFYYFTVKDIPITTEETEPTTDSVEKPTFTVTDPIENTEPSSSTESIEPTTNIIENPSESVTTEPTETVSTDPVETTEATEPSTGVVEKPSESVTTDPVESTVLTETTETTEKATTAEPVESTATEPTESEPTSSPVTSSQDESEPSTSTSSSDETKPTEPEDDKGLLGDVNGDGKVNVKDATLIQKFAAKITALTEVESLRADVNGDTKINVKDATAIQKFAAKIETGFPIGKPIK